MSRERVPAGANEVGTNGAIPVYEGSHECSEGTVPVLLSGLTTTVYATSPEGATPVTVNLPYVGEFLFEALGDYGYGGVPVDNVNHRADAGYATDDNWAGANLDSLLGIAPTATYRGVTSLLSDMGTGTMGIVNWGVYDSNHDYMFGYTPASISDTSVQFVISDWWDSWYAGGVNDNQGGLHDNEGSITVYVYECTVKDGEEESVCPVPGQSEFASSVESSLQGSRRDGSPVLAARSVPAQGLVLEFGDSQSNFYSLGFGGWIIVGFTDIMVDAAGPDLRITEDTWGAYPLEQADVLVSQDGISWTPLGVANNTNSVNATHTTSEFNLADIGWGWAKYVMIEDTTDPAAFNSRPEGDGYDLNAVEALSVGYLGECEEPTLLPLKVTKTVVPFVTRSWHWTIKKTADNTELTLYPGQKFQVYYGVTIDASSTDSDWRVGGLITIHNPNAVEAVIKSVEDEVSPDIAASFIGCLEVGGGGPVTFPYTLAAGGDLGCNYNVNLPDGAWRTNTATVVTSGDVPGNSFSADVDFADPVIEEVDECIHVNDTYEGDLGQFCIGEVLLWHTIVYDRWIGPFDEPGTYDVDNTASFVTNDTKATGEDSLTVVVTVPGCTLTQGYWKNHSKYGRAPYDDAWDNLEDEMFFKSSQTYYEVLKTAPKGGNAYYQLAHQYIAAQLNMLNGASGSSIQAAFDDATELLENTTPDKVRLMKGSAKGEWTNLAGILSSYNEGWIGPGHCDMQRDLIGSN